MTELNRELIDRAPVGYVQFGKGPDFDYAPVCFDALLAWSPRSGAAFAG